jgi:hypothetical protein
LIHLLNNGSLLDSPPWSEIATQTSPAYSPSFPLVHFPNNTCPHRLLIASRYVKEWGATSGPLTRA